MIIQFRSTLNSFRMHVRFLYATIITELRKKQENSIYVCNMSNPALYMTYVEVGPTPYITSLTSGIFVSFFVVAFFVVACCANNY